MIRPNKLLKELKKNNINFFTGVPDSVLKEFINLIPENQNFISQNEGSAVALAAGYHLSSKKIPLVYLQNSGLGNAINPLISITHKAVYSLPIILLIGWRGSPKSNDEPQHITQGAITINFLKLMGIKYIILNNEKNLIKIKKLINHSKGKNEPVAILLKKSILSKANKKIILTKSTKNISRAFAIESILRSIKKTSKIISSTGYNSREVYQIRKDKKLNKGSDFYLVGGMGHTSNLALGVSLKTNSQVISLDGDGSMLMHLGSFINILLYGRKNFKYILLNNNSHESVGSQKTNINMINIKLFSKSLGFKNYYEIKNKKNFYRTFNKFYKSIGPSFLNIHTKEGTLNNLSRPKNLLNVKNLFKKNFKK
jgi:phosphonopyruvate decarboxylase